VERALAAAQASLYAGAFDGALSLIGAAEAGAPDAFQQARIDLLRAEIAFATRDREASTLLLGAVEQIEPWDAGRARAGYLDALSASLFAARLAPPGERARSLSSSARVGHDVVGEGAISCCSAPTPRARARRCGADCGLRAERP
jgi:hypothetical protein